MLYTLFVLFTGVYLGQEYTFIPSVKVLILNLIVYIKNNETTNERTNDENNTIDTHNKIEYIVNWLKEKIR